MYSFIGCPNIILVTKGNHVLIYKSVIHYFVHIDGDSTQMGVSRPFTRFARRCEILVNVVGGASYRTEEEFSRENGAI